MHNLIRFIKLNQFLLLFLIIEGFSVFLLLQNNSYQANTAIKFSTQYSGFIHNYTTAFSDYIALKETNNYYETSKWFARERNLFVKCYAFPFNILIHEMLANDHGDEVYGVTTSNDKNYNSTL